MITAVAKRAYERLPVTTRGLVVSAYGLILNRRRFGAETKQLQAEARQRETWSLPQWRESQQVRLAYILRRAATQVPYYRDFWKRQKGDQAAWEVLANWPLLDRAAIQENPLAFVADDQDRREMLHESTSGTSGSPLTLLRSRRTERAWFALVQERTLHWHGLDAGDRYALLGGQAVVPYSRRKPPFWVWNAAMKQLYLSSYHLVPRFAEEYLKALKKYQVRYISGFSSSIDSLAASAMEAGCAPPEIALVLTHSEPLLPAQRKNIEQFFNCPVFQAYGMTELLAAASTCRYGTLHTWPEVGYIEVAHDSGNPLNSGELVCTSLLDEDMPLIRYRTGDMGLFADPTQSCPCGRTLPALAMLDGRTEDLIWTAAGGRVCLPPWPDDVPVRESQVIQESLDRVTVLYVPKPHASRDSLQSVTRFLQSFLGPVTVNLTAMDAIPRGANGKVRPVICQIAPREVAARTSGSAANP